MRTVYYFKGLDYGFDQTNLLFSSDQRIHMFNVSIIDDMNLESNETFIVSITAPDHTQLEVEVSPIVVEIHDNDGIASYVCITAVRFITFSRVSIRIGK